MKRFVVVVLSLVMICSVQIGSFVHAGDADPFVLIPKAKDTNYGTKVDKLTDPNTNEGKKFWNAYNSIADGYMKSKTSSKQY